MMNSAPKNNVTDNMLNAQLQRLPREMTPSRDLWSGIEKAINQPQSNNKTSSFAQFFSQTKTPLAWAASVLVAVLISTQLNQHSTKSVALTTQNTPFNAVKFMQTNFQQQKQSLLISYQQSSTKNLPIATQKELQILEKAQQSIYSALKNDANNQALLNLLQYTQQQELKLLEQVYRPHWQSI